MCIVQIAVITCVVIYECAELSHVVTVRKRSDFKHMEAENYLPNVSEVQSKTMIHKQNEKPERRIRVPWMFLDEWKRVYEDLYSKNIELQRRGYERLLVWKARQNRLPAGVDCTLELIHVHIIDQDVTLQISKGARPTYAEHDMQLMCSAAITRFLNHVSNVAKADKDTMYKMAEKLNIPNWLVLLRHDSAHSSTLPSISVLRMAVNFALEWLHENYWKESASITSLNFSTTKSRSNEEHVGRILDIWQSLRMYQINGYNNLSEIPDEHLRKSVMRFVPKKSEEDNEESFAKNAELGSLIKIINGLRRNLFRAVKGNRSKSERLIAMLLECETFIPSADFIASEDAALTHVQILTWISLFWKKLLIPLQENFGLFPSLVHKLLVLLNEEKSEHRQLVMALWIKQLCISMLKCKAIIEESYNLPGDTIKKYINLKTEKREKLKPRVDIHPKVVAVVEKKFRHLRDGYFALQNDDKGNSCPLTDLKFAVLNPNEFTKVFLPSLIDVTRPKLSEQRKRLLQELVSIMVTKDVGRIDSNERIHTLTELSLNKKFKSDISRERLSNNKVELTSEYDWTTCPLGILPWQKESPVMLGIPPHVTWELTENTAPNLPKFDNTQIPLIQEKINWPEILTNNSAVRTKLKKKRLIAKKKKKASQHLYSH